MQLVPRLTRAAVKASPPPTNSSSAAAQPPLPPPSPLLEFDEEEPDTPVGGVHDAPRSAAQVTFRFWLHNMVPIGAAQGLTFACSNAAYMYLTITFNQMLAALTPSVTLLLLYLLGVETPTRRTSAAVVLISAGCFISSYGEGRLRPRRRRLPLDGDRLGGGMPIPAACSRQPPPAAAACRPHRSRRPPRARRCASRSRRSC